MGSREQSSERTQWPPGSQVACPHFDGLMTRSHFCVPLPQEQRPAFVFRKYHTRVAKCLKFKMLGRPVLFLPEADWAEGC